MRRGARSAPRSLALLAASAPLVTAALLALPAMGQVFVPPATSQAAPFPSAPLGAGPLGPSVVWEECCPSACPWQIGPQGAVILGDVIPGNAILGEPILGEVIPGDGAPPSSLPRGKPGPLQAVSLTADWFPRFGSDGLGSTDLKASLTLGLPCPTRKSPLLITPSFAAHYLDGPAAPDLPPRLYNAVLEFRHLRPLTERWMLDLVVAPGIYSDFENDSSDALRITGRAVGIWQYTPTTKLIFGVVYLDRDDVNLLPAVGMICEPNDCWKIELIFPRPRIARRMPAWDYDLGGEAWGYLAAEFGGGSWAIERADGTPDVATLRDYRLIGGIERRDPGRLTHRLELGYVFARQLEYRTATPDFDLQDTLMLRAGTKY